VPVAVAFVVMTPRRHTHGFAVDVVEGHFLLCAMLVVVIALTSSTLEAFGRGRRFRLRTEAFLRLFACGRCWPRSRGPAPRCSSDDSKCNERCNRILRAPPV
jgi:hypothetical protein